MKGLLGWEGWGGGRLRGGRRSLTAAGLGWAGPRRLRSKPQGPLPSTLHQSLFVRWGRNQNMETEGEGRRLGREVEVAMMVHPSFLGPVCIFLLLKD